MGRAPEPELHLFRAADHQLITSLRLRRVNTTDGEGKQTLRLATLRSNAELWICLDYVDDSVVFVEIYQISDRRNAECVQAFGTAKPATLVHSSTPADEDSLKAAKGIRSQGYTQTEKTFARLVIDAITLSLHNSPIPSVNQPFNASKNANLSRPGYSCSDTGSLYTKLIRCCARQPGSTVSLGPIKQPMPFDRSLGRLDDGVCLGNPLQASSSAYRDRRPGRDTPG